MPRFYPVDLLVNFSYPRTSRQIFAIRPNIHVVIPWDNITISHCPQKSATFEPVSNFVRFQHTKNVPVTLTNFHLLKQPKNQYRAVSRRTRKQHGGVHRPWYKKSGVSLKTVPKHRVVFREHPYHSTRSSHTTFFTLNFSYIA